MQWQSLPALPGAQLRLATGLFADPAALFARLRSEIAWEQHYLTIFGRRVASPRQSCWIGDADAVYTYSGTRFAPRAWTPTLTQLREQLQVLCTHQFNSVLCNLYRDGRDSMGWHSDDEPELGPEPLIASLSLGVTRRFRLRHKRDPAQQLVLELPPGSLLLMAGATQRHYRHDLPRALRVQQARINLTFRRLG
ncbi:MAG: alpha-ketoglutarate-dependent dioxygenase AlkB [Rhodanobacteraceae bacterium]|nr:alpha-ketoglutarate-dependent dioxygenase AlkB [Rhodanobacteraceae bacterium]